MNKFFSACLLGAIAAVSATTAQQQKDNDSGYCTQFCRNKGHACNDYKVGSNRLVSCAQACMFRKSGVSQTECSRIVNQQSKDKNLYSAFPTKTPPCHMTVQGHSYTSTNWMCSICKDLNANNPYGVMSEKAGHDGCSISATSKINLVTDDQGNGHYNQGNFVFDAQNNTIYKGKRNHVAVDSKGNLHYSGFGKVLACDAAGSCSFSYNKVTKRFADNAVTCDSEGNCLLKPVSFTPIKICQEFKCFDDGTCQPTILSVNGVCPPLDLKSNLVTTTVYQQRGVSFSANDVQLNYKKDSVTWKANSSDNLTFIGFGKELRCDPIGNCDYKDTKRNKHYSWNTAGVLTKK